MDGLYINSHEGEDWEARLSKFIQDHKTKRIHIQVRVYEATCCHCGQAIEPGKETEYCGHTYCIKCKNAEEEFDEECS